jgi:uracil-DNA glycosylase family 4
MEDPRAELKLLVQATRALMEYTREATPEGAFIDETQVFSPKEVKPKAAPIEESFGKAQSEPVKTLQAPPETPREIPVPKVEPHPQRVESQIPAGQIGFKELFASLGGMGEPAPTPQKRAAAVATKLPDPPKPELAKGPLSKAKVIEVVFEDRMKNQNALEEISAKASKCENCKLCKTRNSVVWGVGPAFAPLMFIGEGPGENEDRQGIPFVGAAGQLLNKIVVATGFSREDMYIANVVKCRPPGNRNPEPDEVAACWPFLEKQVELVSPKVIVTLGRFAAQAMLKTTAPISKLRGVVKYYNKIPLVATFHPAYLLRNPADKRLVWEDMQVVRRVYDEIVG